MKRKRSANTTTSECLKLKMEHSLRLCSQRMVRYLRVPSLLQENGRDGRKKENISVATSVIRTKISFSLVRLILRCVRRSRLRITNNLESTVTVKRNDLPTFFKTKQKLFFFGRKRQISCVHQNVPFSPRENKKIFQIVNFIYSKTS